MAARGIIVRPAAITDIQTLSALLEENGQVDSITGAEQRLKHYVRHQDHHLPVAVANAETMGYAWVQDYGPHLRSGHRTARMHDLFVTSSYRRRGVARLLVEDVKSWASTRGVRWLQWQASRDALAFYTALGYEGDPCPDPDHPFFEIDFGRHDS